MRRLLKFTNYADQLITLIDLGESPILPKSREKSRIKKRHNRLIYQRLRLYYVIPTSRKSQHRVAGITIFGDAKAFFHLFLRFYGNHLQSNFAADKLTLI